MTIPSNLPASTRTPGVYHEFDFSGAGQQLTPLDRRVVIIAEKTAAGTAAADTPVQLYGEKDGDEKCGVGSLAALMNRAALLQAKLSGVGAPEILVCPVAENAGGTAAIYTITILGPATASRDLIMKLAGRLVTVGVTAGDAQNTVATAIKNKLDELAATLPFTATVLANVVTLTFRTKGTNGNDVARKNLQVPAGLTVTHANPTPGVGATAIASALAALYDKVYDGKVLANHSTADAAGLLVDAATSWGFGEEKFCFYAMGERGSLGTAQTLQGSYNDYRFLIFNVEATGSLPGELGVMGMIAWMAREAPNANLDGEIIAADPPDAPDAFGTAEVESALASGICPLVPAGAFCKLVRLVTTQITVSGVPFEPTREPALPRTAAYMARQIDIGLEVGLRQEVKWRDPAGGDDIYKRARDIVVDKHRAAERARYLRDVDSFLPEIRVEDHPSVPGRLVAQDPMAVAGPLHQIALNHTMYLR